MAKIPETLPDKQKLIDNIGQLSLKDITNNSVALIGSYSDLIIKTVRDCIQEIEPTLTPILANNVKSEHGMTPRQKLHAILSVCSFVIAEDSIPCGEMIELEYCRHTGAITAIMHYCDERSTFMTLDYGLHSPDFKTFNYSSTKKEEIINKIKEILAWVKGIKDTRDEEIKKFDLVKLASSKYCAKAECKDRIKHPAV